MSLKFFLIFLAFASAQDVKPPSFLVSTRSPVIITPTCPPSYILTPEGCVPVQIQTPCVTQNCATNFQNGCSCCSYGSQQQVQWGFTAVQCQQSYSCAQQCQNQGYQSCNFPIYCSSQPQPNPTNPCTPTSCTEKDCPKDKECPKNPDCPPERPCPPITTTTERGVTTSTTTTRRRKSTTSMTTKITTSPPINDDNQTTRKRRKPSRKPQPISYNIYMPPINNTIININNITRPVYLNNMNTNNIYIYSSAKCEDGSIKTVIVKNNNETISECTNVNGKSSTTTMSPDFEFETTDPTEDKDDEHNHQCCDIYTPRRCKQENKTWICGHRKYQYCLPFCGNRSKIFLQPKRPVYQGIILVVPALQIPNPNYCYGRHCKPPIGK